jgi:hypothetical protein
MTMENLMKALMESATQSQQGTPQQSAGGDAMSQVLGGLMGAGAQALSQQGGAGGGGALSQVIGGLLGGGAQGGNQGDQLLGALEQVIGGQPGTGQPLTPNTSTPNLSANDPIMLLLQPVVTQLAAKANISPQIAMVVASIAVHYLLSSHPSTSPNAPMDLGNVMQQLSSGSISSTTLNKSGMVNDVMQATGLSKPEAVKSLNATFGALSASVGSGRKAK